MALVATDLVFRYGERLALDRVSLRVDAGEVLGVLGPNGAGKSTLARVILGLEAPSSGSVLLDDVVLSSLPIAARAKKIAAVLQAEATSFAFSVQELVMFARAVPAFSVPAERDHRAVEEALRKADAWDLRERTANALSGGERQRVLLARALAQDTPYLVLDEPTAFLDLRHRHMFASIVRSLGKAIVWILHDPDLALRYCTSVCVLDHGRIAAKELSPAVLARVFAVSAEQVLDAAGRPHLLVTGAEESR